MSEVYRVGYNYRDLTSTKAGSGDEFLKWLSQADSAVGGPNTIGSTGGIRPKKFINKGLQIPEGFEGLPSSLILTTTTMEQARLSIGGMLNMTKIKDLKNTKSLRAIKYYYL